MTIVYLNGEFLPEESARVPVNDRGFVFGDGVYEVIPAYGGRLFRLEEHLLRLQHSLDGVRINNPLSVEQWRQMLTELLERNDGARQDMSVYLQVTRGVAKRDHAFPAGVTPTVYASASPISPLSQQACDEGVAVVCLPDIRWQHCNIKAITLLPNVLLRQQAVDAGAVEAILVRDGLVTEGAASNVFMVRDGVIVTPPKSQYLLPGITRDLVLEIAQSAGLKVLEQCFTPEELRQADEIWLTSSTREVVAVTRLDGAPVGDGRPGAVWAQVYALYQDYKQRLREGEA